MKLPIVILFLCSCLTSEAQTKDVQYYYTQAKEAHKAKDYPKYYEMIKAANGLHPYHQGILYQLGTAAALTGHKQEAIDNLKKAILIDISFKLEGLEDFSAIASSPEFKHLVELQKEWQRAVIHSDTAFVLHDRSLHTEGIAYDATSTTFYLGSIRKRKIVKVTSKGEVSDFCQPAVQGMTSIFGLKVDEKRNLLWVCSSPMVEMENFDSTARSAVYKFDTKTGKLLEKYARPATATDGVFGDLVLTKDGQVIVSDSKNNTLFTVVENSHSLDLYFESPEFSNIQGLSFSENDKYLFISDYIKGLFRLDVKTKVLSQLPCKPEVSLKGIDGLTYFDHSLIAVQNGTNPLRVTRYFLDADLSQITTFEIVDRNHPAFGEPTIGIMAGKSFYYIANSQWGGYERDHTIKPDSELHDIVVLKAKVGK